MSADCLFCRIGRGEIDTKLVFDDDHSFAFEDINPQAPTHVLICPREHLSSLGETEPAHGPTLGRLLAAAATIARQRDLDSFRTVINSGAGAGQSVFHIHVHLLGGRPMGWPPG